MTSTDPIYFLLVDDLEENILSLDALLQRDSLVLLKAKSGPEALELLLKYEVALALVDVQMPGMDGFELAELMRGIERTRRVPIIFLTAGSTDTQRRFRGYETGAVDFLQKPIEADVLRSKAAVFFELAHQKKILQAQRDTLREQAEALKETDHRKDVFLATLAHELRNPLAPISNGLEIIKSSRDEKVIAQVQAMMERQVDHMVHLIDDLLDVSRISQGKITLRKEVISLQSALQAAIEASRPLIDRAQHTLTVNIPQEPIFVNGDAIRLTQIFSNLLNNAAKYTKEGGEITLRAVSQDGNVKISITDNGLGIRQDLLPKVFDLFTQIDRSLERSQGGLGIGLALVKELLVMHGGTIHADSQGLGHGSTFTVSLNAVNKASDEKSSTAVSSADATPASLNILIVDDNVESAKTLSWMLELIGHQSQICFNGTDALKLANEILPDVILLDIGLPGMNGYEVCQQLRLNDVFKNTYIIAQTGWGQDKDRKLAEEAGFDRHLVKPINIENLTELLAQR